MDLMTFVTSVVAGIVSSVLTVVILEMARRSRDRSAFGTLAGRYAHYSILGERLLDGVTEIAHRGGNILDTHGSSSEGTWEGRIVMSRDLPSSGSGIYQYPARTDCGTHHVQLAPDRLSWFVLAVNTSHGKNSATAYVWRRADQDS